MHMVCPSWQKCLHGGTAVGVAGVGSCRPPLPAGRSVPGTAAARPAARGLGRLLLLSLGFFFFFSSFIFFSPSVAIKKNRKNRQVH